MKKILILTIPLMLLFAPAVFACNPLPEPPAGTNYDSRRYTGPDITGTLTFYCSYRDPISPDACANTTVSADLACRNSTLSGDQPGFGALFDVVSVDYLVGDGDYWEDGPPTLAVPDGCSSSKEFAVPVVYKVLKFSQPDRNTKIFKIVGKFLYPTPY